MIESNPTKAEFKTLSHQNKIIVALDVETTTQARKIIEELGEVVGAFKIGNQLFTSGGLTFVHELVENGIRVFLDLKFHDIPSTVSRAGIEAARLGVWMFNVHASGGSEMMKRTVNDVGEFCFKSNLDVPRIIGVTVLTSSDADTLREVGIGSEVDNQVARLARLSAESGLHGVVASPNEIDVIRSAVDDPNFLIVTPGIRLLSATNDDQRRVMTPGEAISKGSNYLVIGRPIVASPNPRFAAAGILEEMSAVPQ